MEDFQLINDPICCGRIVNKLYQKGFSKRDVEIIMQGWRISTSKQYKVYIDNWENYCEQFSFDPFHSNINQTIEFLICLIMDILIVVSTLRSLFC